MVSEMVELWQIHDDPEYFEKFENGELPVGYDEFCHTLVEMGAGRKYFYCNTCGYVKKNDVVPANEMEITRCKCGSMVLKETYSDAEYEHLKMIENMRR